MNIKNLLDDNSVSIFGEVDLQAKPRHTVVAVVFDPSSRKYLCQYWEAYNGLTCLLSGGVEEGEDNFGALKREITEETGYTEFQVVGTLGGSIKTYYIKNTGESLVKYITPYLVILNSHKHISINKEEDERFENFLKSPEEITRMMEEYEIITSSTLADHKEILSRAVEFLNTKLT